MENRKPFPIKLIEQLNRIFVPFLVLTFVNILIEIFINLFYKRIKRANLNIPSNEKICLVGGTKGIGLEILNYLIENNNEIILLSFNTPDEKILKYEKLTFIKLDLANIKPLKIKGLTFDTLICNSGVMLSKMDRQYKNFQINYFGHKKIVELLSPKKVVFVSSCVCFMVRSYNIHKTSIFNNKKYSESKLAITVFALEYKKLNPNKSVALVHPGIINTELFNEKITISRILSFLLAPVKISPKQGALNVLNAVGRTTKTDVKFFFLGFEIEIPSYIRKLMKY